MVGFSVPFQRDQFPLMSVSIPTAADWEVQAEEWDRYVGTVSCEALEGSCLHLALSLELRFPGTVVWCLRKVFSLFLPCFQAATAPALTAWGASLLSPGTPSLGSYPATDLRYLRQRSALSPECLRHKPR